MTAPAAASSLPARRMVRAGGVDIGFGPSLGRSGVPGIALAD